VYDEAFNFMSSLVEEAIDFCEEQGYSVSKVSVLTTYDTNVIEDPSKSSRIVSDSDDHFRIVEHEDGSYEAIIFIGAWIEVWDS